LNSDILKSLALVDSLALKGYHIFRMAGKQHAPVPDTRTAKFDHEGLELSYQWYSTARSCSHTFQFSILLLPLEIEKVSSLDNSDDN
jgi:hypothetical protein